jgi:hypothetical protein
MPSTLLRSGLTSPEGYDLGSYYLAKAIADQDTATFQAATKYNGNTFITRMSAMKMGVMWVDAKATKSSQRLLDTHHVGKQLTGIEQEVNMLAKTNKQTMKIFEIFALLQKLEKHLASGMQLYKF